MSALAKSWSMRLLHPVAPSRSVTTAEANISAMKGKSDSIVLLMRMDACLDESFGLVAAGWEEERNDGKKASTPCDLSRSSSKKVADLTMLLVPKMDSCRVLRDRLDCAFLSLEVGRPLRQASRIKIESSTCFPSSSSVAQKGSFLGNFLHENYRRDQQNMILH